MGTGQSSENKTSTPPRIKYINGVWLPYETRSIIASERRATYVAAIDFGTTFCSLSYSKYEEDNVSMVELCSREERVPSSILVSKNGIIEAFGKKAGELHRNHSESYFFHNMKMLLMREKGTSRNTLIKAANGEEFYLVEVIAMILKYIKTRMLNFDLRDRPDQIHLQASDFDWVITVPAIWKDEAKQMMREAAYLAGIASLDMEIERLSHPRDQQGSFLVKQQPDLTKVMYSKLMLAFEPEAAAFYCRQDVQGSLHDRKDLSKYIVVDAGGGTLDITAHCITSSGHIQVILPPHGNNAGGSKVNAEFMSFLGKLVDDAQFEKLLNRSNPKYQYNSYAIHEISDVRFEDTKTWYGNFQYDDMKEVSIDLPYTFVVTYGECLEKNATKFGVKVCESSLIIPKQVFEGFFEPTMDKAMTMIKDILNEGQFHSQIDSIFCVGGFGGCKLFHDRVKQLVDKINPKIFVFRPENHTVAVVKGAISFRKSTDVIQSRVAAATYGTRCSFSFNSRYHDEKYKFFDDDDLPFCKNLFQPYVQVGDTVTSNTCLAVTFQPHSHKQREAFFPLYRSLERNVYYTHDPRDKLSEMLSPIGNLNLELPPDIRNLDKEREILLKFNFVHTEIFVEAYDNDYDKAVHCTVDFLTL